MACARRGCVVASAHLFPVCCQDVCLLEYTYTLELVYFPSSGDMLPYCALYRATCLLQLRQACNDVVPGLWYVTHGSMPSARFLQAACWKTQHCPTNRALLGAAGMLLWASKVQGIRVQVELLEVCSGVTRGRSVSYTPW
jgi:hypothetical protein